MALAYSTYHHMQTHSSVMDDSLEREPLASHPLLLRVVEVDSAKQKVVFFFISVKCLLFRFFFFGFVVVNLAWLQFPGDVCEGVQEGFRIGSFPMYRWENGTKYLIQIAERSFARIERLWNF